MVIPSAARDLFFGSANATAQSSVGFERLTLSYDHETIALGHAPTD
jgi:hypothetical protein